MSGPDEQMLHMGSLHLLEVFELEAAWCPLDMRLIHVVLQS
jgi:hypothetical protein